MIHPVPADDHGRVRAGEDGIQEGYAGNGVIPPVLPGGVVHQGHGALQVGVGREILRQRLDAPGFNQVLVEGGVVGVVGGDGQGGEHVRQAVGGAEHLIIFLVVHPVHRYRRDADVQQVLHILAHGVLLHIVHPVNVPEADAHIQPGLRLGLLNRLTARAAGQEDQRQRQAQDHPQGFVHWAGSSSWR